jgi:asparagine synthase (glutamine-hydrolysing)
MCGIWGVLLKEPLSKECKKVTENKLYEKFNSVSHRGPDRSSYNVLSDPVNATIGFHRLSIMDTSTKGDQPFRYEEKDRTIYVMCNGEIYKHGDICKKYDLEPVSGSDCEIIPLLYKKFGLKGIELMCKEFNSEHAFMILDVDMKTGDYIMILSTDRLGIRPLFVGKDTYGFYFSSELKGIPCLETKDGIVERFKPRHYAIIEKKDGKLGELQYFEYYSLKVDKPLYFDLEESKKNISMILRDAVICRLVGQRKVGVFLSGGLDSSTLAAIAAEELKKSGLILHTFDVGMPNGSDAKYAKMVADYIGSKHTHVEFSEQDFFDVIPDVVKTTGTYDITTNRASCAEYLLARWVSQNTDIKIILCGEMADEICGSYLYFHKAPSPEDAHNECVRLLEDIHMYDGLRADRCISAFGLEARFPYADIRYIENYLRVDPKLRVPIDGLEKWLVRQSFKESKLLPDEVLYRVKEAQSDAVSSRERSWHMVIKENLDSIYTDEYFEEAKKRYEHLPPLSKESLYYREIHTKEYGENESESKLTEYFWLAKWSGVQTDPSARELPIYKELNDKVTDKTS